MKCQSNRQGRQSRGCPQLGRGGGREVGVATGGTPAGMGLFRLAVVHIWVVNERLAGPRTAGGPAQPQRQRCRVSPPHTGTGPGGGEQARRPALPRPQPPSTPGLAPFFPKLLSEKRRLALHSSERLQSALLFPQGLLRAAAVALCLWEDCRAAGILGAGLRADFQGLLLLSQGHICAHGSHRGESGGMHHSFIHSFIQPMSLGTCYVLGTSLGTECSKMSLMSACLPL